jgi:1-acyl-sn-glycerol-3-phosphate acyltransferase
MPDAVSRAWRAAGAGIGFACFGLGGLVLGMVAFPLINTLVRQPGRRAQVAKWVIRQAFRSFIGLLRGLGVFTYEVQGEDRLPAGGALILANHPSLLDVVFLMASVDRADCIVKADLARNPFTRGPVRAAGYVFNDAGAALIDDCINSVRAGNNLIIFPEGTRTAASGAMRLQRGAAHVALQGAIDILPVRIRCVVPFLQKGDKWYRPPLHRPHFEIVFGDTIRTADFGAAGDGQPLAARRLTEHLTNYFLGNIACGTHGT